MTNVIVNDTIYFYEVTGQGDPLLLLHGFTGSSQNWAAHVPILAQHYRVITLDILGHGQTDSPTDPARYRMDKVAEDVTAVLQIVNCQLSIVNLLGYSMGGRLALYLATHYPHRFRALILESASPGLDGKPARAERRTRDNALAERIERDGIAPFVDYWETLPLWASQQQLPPEKHTALRQQRLANNPIGLASSLRGMGTGAQPSLWPHLPALTLPTLLLAGELDAKFVAINQQMHALLPSSQLEIVAGAGHTVHLERPYSFQQAILTFLATPFATSIVQTS
ncbi:MAG: 2-succinyl-6-hydroxy-2,4-cyclohexadiene-1-carboxylate synthase [Ardenticatenaceae bacterium]|nr:2-succinyl-6-hydroxy-2,4-cyclohexadiene-1-carboxylate synthase [Ardenticatenaceae bacterium]MCB8990319.1 2-succinyl-6-hydroxy-2,4-cyclohexadiene-1-carboxylate synthase [Ardenticatenaceae bacterium]